MCCIIKPTNTRKVIAKAADELIRIKEEHNNER